MSNVGKIAGEIWDYLHENGGASTTFKLKMILAIDVATLHFAIGWLLREDKVDIEKLDKGYKVFLKEPAL